MELEIVSAFHIFAYYYYYYLTSFAFSFETAFLTFLNASQKNSRPVFLEYFHSMKHLFPRLNLMYKKRKSKNLKLR